MQYQNLLDNNIHIDISLFFNKIDNNIYNDLRFNQLLSLVEKQPHKYIYALYSESCFLKENLYMPVFHTLYLASKNHNVLIENMNDIWLINTFPNNNYYMLTNKNIQRSLHDKLHMIQSLEEIGVT